MSAGISNTDLVDLQKTTLENLPNLDFEVALNYQQYNVVNEWFKTDKVQVESGTSIVRNIILDTSGNARHVRLFQKTGLNIADVQTRITAPWVQVQSSYSIERREALRNRKPARYIELLKSRRIDGMVSLADLLEQRAWVAPESATDDLNPRGLPYWLSKVVPANGTGYVAATDAIGSFSGRRVRYNGGTDVLTDKGGIDPTAQAKWRNWADTYTGIDADFVKRMRKAFHATHFKSPMLASDLKDGPSSKYRIYMGLSNLTEFEDLTTKANENLGADLDKFHGITTFRRVPVMYTPQLDTDADGVVYGVNHAKFYPITLDGDWMRESDPMSDVEQHNVITTFIDGSYQFFCTNIREAGFVLSTTPAT
jgi:hypothetical protein